MRYLGMHALSQPHWLDLMNQSKYKEFSADTYNQGPLVTLLEERVAGLIGKPKGMLFNKGTTCQMALMKTVCLAKKNNRVVVHPQSHIAQDEQDAYQVLMGLEGVVLGDVGQPFGVEVLEALTTEVAVVVVELPLRRAGFKLTPWDELIKMRQWCDDHGVHFHLDGARLWESAPYYKASVDEKMTFAEIAALFDSVYVSLYKGIGAVSGALLLGSESLLADGAVWRDRLGSNMWTAFPTLITALEGLDHHLPQIPEWVNRAHEIAGVLTEIHGLHVDEPHTNGFQIKFKANESVINDKLLTVQKQTGLQLCKPFAPIEAQSEWLFSEVSVGATHKEISNTEIVSFFKAICSV